jgi:hypothetical protein
VIHQLLNSFSLPLDACLHSLNSHWFDWTQNHGAFAFEKKEHQDEAFSFASIWLTGKSSYTKSGDLK